MSEGLTRGELEAVDQIAGDLLARFLARLRGHSPGTALELAELSVFCAAFAARTEEEGAQLFAARLALASFSDRHPGLELAELVELFAEAAAGRRWKGASSSR